MHTNLFNEYGETHTYNEIAHMCIEKFLEHNHGMLTINPDAPLVVWEANLINLITNAMASNTLRAREHVTLSNVTSIEVRQDGECISAVAGAAIGSDWYSFQVVLNDTQTQKIGDIVG